MRKGQRKKGGGGKNKKKRGANNNRPKLRFSYGDRVACHVDDGWEVGTIVKLWYDTGVAEENRWHDLVVPYQILLDSGDLVYAPEDEDYCILYQTLHRYK